jgi:hypothetical protein
MLGDCFATLAIFASYEHGEACALSQKHMDIDSGHCEEPQATKQSPSTLAVIPAEAGIPQRIVPVDPRFRGDDGK